MTDPKKSTGPFLTSRHLVTLGIVGAVCCSVAFYFFADRIIPTLQRFIAIEPSDSIVSSNPGDLDSALRLLSRVNLDQVLIPADGVVTIRVAFPKRAPNSGVLHSTCRASYLWSAEQGLAINEIRVNDELMTMSPELQPIIDMMGEVIGEMVSFNPGGTTAHGTTSKPSTQIFPARHPLAERLHAARSYQVNNVKMDGVKVLISWKEIGGDRTIRLGLTDGRFDRMMIEIPSPITYSTTKTTPLPVGSLVGRIMGSAIP